MAATIAQRENLDRDELDDHGNSPLHWAVLGGYTEIVHELLKAGVNPNVYSDDGFTPKWSEIDFGLQKY